MPAVLFADAALLLVAHLRSELTSRGVGVAVGTRVPNPRPASLVRVERTGGPRLNLVTDGAQISVECWAPTEKAAHDLAQLCRAVVNDARGRAFSGVAVYRVTEFSGPQLEPDADSEHPRYRQTFQLSTRGAAT